MTDPMPRHVTLTGTATAIRAAKGKSGVRLLALLLSAPRPANVKIMCGDQTVLLFLHGRLPVTLPRNPDGWLCEGSVLSVTAESPVAGSAVVLDV